MRKRNFRLVGMLSIGFFLVMSTAFAAEQAVPTTTPSAAQQSVINYTPSPGVPKVLISKSSKPIPLQLKGPDWLQAIAPPAPLTQVQRAAIIKDVRRVAGISGNLPPNPPAKVVLTADAPRVGPNWVTLVAGYNYPGGGGYEAITAPHAFIRTQDSWIVLHFGQLTPGKMYMLDIKVGTGNNHRPHWILSGEAEGILTPSSGHILAGFVASGPVGEIGLQKTAAVSGYFFGCELTPMN
jgi:hypothetical protein